MACWKCKFCDYKTKHGPILVTNLGKCPRCKQEFALIRFDPLDEKENTSKIISIQRKDVIDLIKKSGTCMDKRQRENVERIQQTRIDMQLLHGFLCDEGIISRETAITINDITSLLINRNIAFSRSKVCHLIIGYKKHREGFRSGLLNLGFAKRFKHGNIFFFYMIPEKTFKEEIDT